MTERAVSVTVNFALSLVVATLLLGALLFVSGSLVDTQQDRIVRSELRVVGDRLAASIMTADRLAETGANTVTVRTEAPTRVGGVGYHIEVNATTGNSELVLKPDGKLSTVSVLFTNVTSVESGSVTGGDIQIVLTGSGSLEVKSNA